MIKKQRAVVQQPFVLYRKTKYYLKRICALISPVVGKALVRMLI